MKKANSFLLISIVAGLIFMACKKGGTGDNTVPIVLEPIGSSSNKPGLGDNAGLPTGTDWVLPPRIKVVKRTNHPFDPDVRKLYGAANTFYTDISFVNDSSASVTVNIPAGLTFVQFVHHRMQYGISPQAVTIIIPPSGPAQGPGRDTTTIYLGLACVNKQWALPWEDYLTSDVEGYPLNKGFYEPGKITDDANLKKLFTLLADKPKLRVQKHYNPHEQYLPDYVEPEWTHIYSSIQVAITSITDGNGITKSELEELSSELQKYR